MSIGDRLKEARQHLGLSQATFAKNAGIPLGTYKKYEGDERSPGSDALASLGKLGININWLLNGDGPMMVKDMDKPGPDVNPETLTAVIEGLEQALEVRHLRLAPDRKARAIGVLYDFCKKSGRQEPAAVERFLDLMV